MDILFQPGFLGTRSPLFMDIVSVIVVFLPFLIFGAILLAKKKRYQAHESVQKLLFIVTVIVVLFFEVGVRYIGGYEVLIEGSSVEHNYFIYVLIFHIIISVVTLILWSMILYSARRYKREKTLPGLYSEAHKKAGQRTFIGIILTMLTGGWVYALLFVV